MPAIEQAAVPHSNLQTDEARLQSASGVSSANVSQQSASVVPHTTLQTDVASLHSGSGPSSQASVPGQQLVDQTISTPCRSQAGADF